LDCTKPLAAGAQAKISVGSFLPFSTASTKNENAKKELAEKGMAVS